MKVAILAGRPKDGTFLPKTERYLWNEICRVMESDLSLPVFKDATFLIPIYSKFDLHALYLAEKQTNLVEYYVPSMEWGSKYLPKHQKMLISRMEFQRHIIPNPHARMIKMIEDADVVYSLSGTEGFERFSDALVGKTVCHLDFSKMNFTTEEGGQEYYDMLKTNTAIYVQNRKELDEDGLNEVERLHKMFADAGDSLSSETEGY